MDLSQVLVQYRAVKNPRIEFGMSGLKVVLPKFYTKPVAELLHRHRVWIAKRQMMIESLKSGQLPVVKRDESTFMDLVQIYLTESTVLVQKQPTLLRYRNMKSRWGSCKRTGEITLSKKLTSVPDELVGYVVHHEVCHLAEMNHGPRFWRLVALKYPLYKQLKKQLSHYGLLLN